jgi:hypothetical protein
MFAEENVGILNINTFILMLSSYLRLNPSLFERCKKEWLQNEWSVLLEFTDIVAHVLITHLCYAYM